MPKILLVEDNEMNRDMLSRRPLRKGFEGEPAVEGPQGPRIIRGTRWRASPSSANSSRAPSSWEAAPMTRRAS